MLQETAGSEQIAPCEVEEKVFRIMTRNTNQSKDESKKKKEGKLLKEKNTEDGVNFRGEGCNVPPIHP